jgi:hypothetical protein
MCAPIRASRAVAPNEEETPTCRLKLPDLLSMIKWQVRV